MNLMLFSTSQAGELEGIGISGGDWKYMRSRKLYSHFIIYLNQKKESNFDKGTRVT